MHKARFSTSIEEEKTNIMSLVGYYWRLGIGHLYQILHRKQFPGRSDFYGIPRVNRLDQLTCGEGLKISANVYINTDGGVKIGNRVTLSYGVSILAASYDKKLFFKGIRQHNNRGIEIGDDVWVGANATILDGVHICNNVIIGAGAVVTQNIYTPYSVYAGVPARQINIQDEK